MERVRPQDIRNTALLTVEGELDDISGSGQTKAAHDLCEGINTGTKEQRHLEVQGAGHYGIFSGRRWRDVVHPAVRDFIREYEAPHRAQLQAQADAAKATKAGDTHQATTPAKPVASAANSGNPKQGQQGHGRKA